MFEFIKKMFVAAMTFSSGMTLNIIPLKCVSMNNRECKVRSKIININSNEPLFYRCSIKTSKFNGSCNNINDLFAKLCVPDVAKNLNVRVLDLVSITNEARHIDWHETCKGKCRLDASVDNNKQWWNEDKCRCECKELIDKGVCDKGFIGNLSHCKCECDKSCDIGEYLDYESYQCRKKLVDKLVEGCTEHVDEKKIAKITLAEDENKCNLPAYCTFSIVFTVNIGIGTYFIYYKYINRDKETVAKYDYVYQTTI